MTGLRMDGLMAARETSRRAMDAAWMSEAVGAKETPPDEKWCEP